MLKQLTRLERTRNLFIIGFIALMAIALVGGTGLLGKINGVGSGPASTNEVLAKVGGDEITVADLNSQKEQLQKRFGGQISFAQLGYTDRKFLDGLIQGRIVEQEAKRLGLAASDAEVSDTIRKQFKDSSGNFVGFDRYKEIVGDYGKFEDQIRQQIAYQKLKDFITAGVRVSEEEVQENYVRQNTTFDIAYVLVAADKVAQKIQPSDEDLRAYFEQHKTDYRIFEPQKKIRYIFIDQEKAGSKLQISDQDLRAEYDKLPPENKQAGVKVQQIVLKIARPDLDATVKQKAADLVTQARGQSGSATEQAFADLARGNSEDPATAKNGGSLPAPVKKNPNAKNATESSVTVQSELQKLPDMQEGAVSDPVKIGNAYYIFRRGAPVPKSFEDAKQELLVSLRNRQSYKVAADLAAQAAQRLKETKDIQAVAAELAPKANMTPAEMVRETPYIKPGDDVPNIGSSQQFEQAIEPLNNVGDIGERTPVKNGFAIPVLADKKEPRIPEFDEVKDKVAQAVKQERAKGQLEATARNLASGTNSAGDLKAAAENLGLEAKTADAFKLGSPLGDAGASPAVDEALLSLKAGEVSKTPLKVGENWVVVAVTKRTEADLAEFAKQREKLTQDALSQRQNQVFDDYVASIQNRMQSEGKIKIYNDVLARLNEDAEVAPPPQMPRRPPQSRAPFPTK